MQRLGAAGTFSRHMRHCLCLFIVLTSLTASNASVETAVLWPAPAILPTIEDGHEISYEIKVDAPKSVMAWWESQPALRAEAKPDAIEYKKLLIKNLASARRGRITGKSDESLGDNSVSVYTYATARDKADEIAKLEADIAEQTVLIGSIDRVLFYSQVPPAVDTVVGNPIVKVHQIIDRNG